MNTLALIALCSISLGAGDGETYATAHQETVKTGKPMLVMVSTEWCVPCQTMKRTILPQIRQRGLLRRVAFGMVDPDRDTELAHQLIGGGPVPQLVIFRKTNHGWMKQNLVGLQTVEAVEGMINEAVAANQADADAEKAAKSKAGSEPAKNAKVEKPKDDSKKQVAATTAMPTS